MARTDVLTTARRIRRQLGSQHRQEVLVLASAITDSDTTLNFTTDLPLGLAVGQMLCVDFEALYVQSINTTTNAVTVIRGYLDTEAAAHAAASMVEMAPRFSLPDIYDAMQSEVQSWAPALF